MCCYLAPINSNFRKQLETDAWDSINDFLCTIASKGKLFLCGDLNARTGNLSDLLDPSKLVLSNQLSHSLPPELNIESHDTSNYISTIPPRNNQDTTINSDGRALIDTCISTNLHILNGRTVGDLFGSRTLHNVRGSSCIDYVLAPTDSRLLVKSFKVLNFTEFSDHCPLSITLSLPSLNPDSAITNKTSTNYADTVPQKFIINKDASENYSKCLGSSEFLGKFDDFVRAVECGEYANAPHDANNNFTNILTDCAERVLKKSNPILNSNNRGEPKQKQKWFDKNCKLTQKAFRKSVHKFNAAKAKKSSIDPQTMNDLIKKLYDNKKIFRHRVKISKKCHLKRLNKNIEDGKIVDWKKFNQLKNFHGSSNPLGLNDLLAFENFFKNLYEKNPPTVNTNIRDLYDYVPLLARASKFNSLNTRIGLDEVTEAVNSLKPGKSSSLDLIPNEFIKCLPPKGLTALTSLFNLCLTLGKYPWNSSVIVPLHKSGDKHNPDNYRAIGISSCLGKTFSTILLNRLSKFRDENCPDPPNQLGFCKNAQTNDHVLTLKTIIDKYYTRTSKKK